MAQKTILDPMPYTRNESEFHCGAVSFTGDMVDYSDRITEIYQVGLHPIELCTGMTGSDCHQCHE